MIKKTLNKFRDKLFSTIHSKNLIYNTCWEDPKVDRKLLQLNEDSNLVVITSAGCNALDYLLDLPQNIHCVDMNPKQNALLELKISLIKQTNYSTLFKFFGDGKIQSPKVIYTTLLKPYLSDYSIDFWDKKIKYFKDNNNRKTFYYKGTSGKFAWLVNKFLKSKPKLNNKVEKLFNAENIAEQQKHYSAIDDIFNNIIIKWFLNLHLTLALLGVPRDQFNLITNEYPDGMIGYLKEKFRRVFAELPISNNYFWRVYFFGNYSKKCCPSYLKKKNYDVLKNNSDKINLHTNTITNFLIENPGEYSHYVLLDHQDWLAVNNPMELEREWKMIFANSFPGTKVLLRSASFNRDFLPKFVLDKIDFDDDLVAKYDKKDRVGTYGSTHFGVIK